MGKTSREKDLTFLGSILHAPTKVSDKDTRLRLGNDPDSTEKLLDGLDLRTEPEHSNV